MLPQLHNMDRGSDSESERPEDGADCRKYGVRLCWIITFGAYVAAIVSVVFLVGQPFSFALKHVGSVCPQACFSLAGYCSLFASANAAFEPPNTCSLCRYDCPLPLQTTTDPICFSNIFAGGLMTYCGDAKPAINRLFIRTFLPVFIACFMVAVCGTTLICRLRRKSEGDAPVNAEEQLLQVDVGAESDSST